MQGHACACGRVSAGRRLHARCWAALPAPAVSGVHACGWSHAASVHAPCVKRHAACSTARRSMRACGRSRACAPSAQAPCACSCPSGSPRPPHLWRQVEHVQAHAPARVDVGVEHLGGERDLWRLKGVAVGGNGAAAAGRRLKRAAAVARARKSGAAVRCCTRDRPQRPRSLPPPPMACPCCCLPLGDLDSEAEEPRLIHGPGGPLDRRCEPRRAAAVGPHANALRRRLAQHLQLLGHAIGQGHGWAGWGTGAEPGPLGAQIVSLALV